MYLEITRKWNEGKVVTGVLKVFNNESEKSGSALFTCFTLEEDKEGIERNKDLRVPAGEYKLKRHTGSSWNTRLHNLLNEYHKVKSLSEAEQAKRIKKNKEQIIINIYNDKVPFDRRILIHWGNSEDDTAGCILLGKSNDNLKDSFIGQSKAACGEFYTLMENKNVEDFKLVIRNNF